MTNQEREEAIRELPFILSGEYRPDCECEHCVGIKKHIKSALLALKAYRGAIQDLMASGKMVDGIENKVRLDI